MFLVIYYIQTTTTALIRSAERGRLAVVKYLVEELGADIDGPDAVSCASFALLGFLMLISNRLLPSFILL